MRRIVNAGSTIGNARQASLVAIQPDNIIATRLVLSRFHGCYRLIELRYNSPSLHKSFVTNMLHRYLTLAIILTILILLLGQHVFYNNSLSAISCEWPNCHLSKAQMMKRLPEAELTKLPVKKRKPAA